MSQNKPVCLDDSIQPITKEFRDHARALLLSLGKDPNPSNISKLKGIKIHNGVKISAELKDYLVYESSLFIAMLEKMILTYPFSLPAKYLALFISYSVSNKLDFSCSIQLAENFKKNPTDNSLWVLRSFIGNDIFINDHLTEILVSEFGSSEIGIQEISKVFGFKSPKLVHYREKSYWILDVDPVSRIQQILSGLECLGCDE